VALFRTRSRPFEPRPKACGPIVPSPRPTLFTDRSGHRRGPRRYILVTFP